MNKQPMKKDSDIPMPVALVILVGVAFVLLAGSATPRLADEIAGLARAFEENLLYLTTAVAAGSFSAAWMSAQYRRIFKLTKQGSRLQSLLGRPVAGKKEILKRIFFASFVGGAAFGVCLFVPDTKGLPFHLTSMQDLVWSAVEVGSALILAFSASVMTIVLYDPLLKALVRKEEKVASLGQFPTTPNTLTLGSIDEGVENKAPTWVTLDRRALNGNILITGSIGAGKTQGTILTYFDQMLGTFDPKPSVLAIDPKGTFAPEAKRIIKARKLSRRCVHLSLGGKVAFNPIYVPNALKDARFMDVAYMIQSAATNFMGRSSGSVFWETHSLTLIRNSLAYCAAKYGYYTLLDLNETILAAVGDELPEKIKEILETKTLDEEERFNIMRSYDYFALEFRKLEDKVRTSILATATAFLNQFQEYQASQIFCPKENDKRLKSLDDVVDKGKILLLDIRSPALAKSMGTIIKLLYQQSLLDRLKDKTRGKKVCGLLLIDEYQDVVTTSNGTSVGDDRFFAKGREANAISIVATQSLTSLQDAIGRDTSAKSLFQCFRTRIAAHSSDLATIHAYQELVGQEEREKVSHSFSELSQDAKKNYMLGGFESNNANISESVSKSLQKESVLTGKEFFALTSFECFALIYDGIRTKFHRLFLKPHFLANKATSHVELLAKMAAVGTTAALSLVLASASASGFPNICSVVKTEDFSSCMEFKVSSCTCGYPPHPCAQFSYYVPSSFVEVHPNPGETFFGDLPAARGQLSSLAATALPYGAEGDTDTQSFQAHTLAIPLASTVMGQLPCSSQFRDTTCFESMSEHLGPKWTTGAADQFQPNFLAWMASPKACLMAGAAMSIAGGDPGSFGGSGTMCSVPMSMERYPPSAHFACNGWGVFYPRVGVYSGPSQTAGALMVAARMKSIASEVFQSTPSSPGDKWQMITPQSSSCFREGENVLPLETFKRATEYRRLAGAPPKGFLFAIWQPVSCCKEYSEVPTSQAVLAAIKAACQAGGGL